MDACRRFSLIAQFEKTLSAVCFACGVVIGKMNEKMQAIVSAIMLAMLVWIITEQRAWRLDVHQDIAALRDRVARMEVHLSEHMA